MAWQFAVQAATLSLSAFLASAANASELQTFSLPIDSAQKPYEPVNSALKAWVALRDVESPAGVAFRISPLYTERLKPASVQWRFVNRAHLLASWSSHSSDEIPVQKDTLGLSKESGRKVWHLSLGFVVSSWTLIRADGVADHTCVKKVKYATISGTIALVVVAFRKQEFVSKLRIRPTDPTYDPLETSYCTCSRRFQY